MTFAPKMIEGKGAMEGLNFLLQPSLTPILRSRTACLAITGATATHILLTVAGLPSWQCPIRYGLGIPCPGCGLSRAVVELGHGHWHEALKLHAFAPMLILGLLLIAIAGLLPHSPRVKLVDGIEQIEVKTYLASLFLLGLFFYWLIRLLFFTEELYRLVM